MFFLAFRAAVGGEGANSAYSSTAEVFLCSDFGFVGMDQFLWVPPPPPFHWSEMTVYL